MSDTWTLTARWLIPVDRPPLEQGRLRIQGERIIAIEPAGSGPADVDMGNAAIVPGLVNAHTHLDLSGLAGQCPPSEDFTGWLRQVIAHRRQQTPEQIEADIRFGLEQSLRFGTTLLGDIAAQGLSWSALAAAPVRAVVFHELLGLTAARAETAWQEAQSWLNAHPATSTCRPGFSPHAPYSVRRCIFEQTARLPASVPVAIHLAESRAEIQLLQHHAGPFVEFLQNLGVWDETGLIESVERLLTLYARQKPLLIHGNYLTPAMPIPPGVSVIYCPRTHAAFGQPPHPFRELLARGICVALGTDSLASNPDLDILTEARFLHQRYPDVPPAALLRMATLAGAEALGWEHITGSLTVGKSADLLAVPLPDEDDLDPCRLVLRSEQPIQRVLFRGVWRE